MAPDLIAAHSVLGDEPEIFVLAKQVLQSLFIPKHGTESVLIQDKPVTFFRGIDKVYIYYSDASGISTVAVAEPESWKNVT